jgi:prepilin-type N-terminal cleavage/methylation domain-containing protein
VQEASLWLRVRGAAPHCPNLMPSKFNTHRAFTLLELLVVVAIIAVLAGLLLPVYSNTKAKAGKATCINNLRQISLAVRMYADDSRDNSPEVKPDGARDPFTAYKEYLKGYVGSQQASPRANLFACPGDKFYYDYDTRISRSLHAEVRNNYSSYAFNAGNAPTGVPTGTPPVHPWPGIAGRRLSSIKEPEKTLLVVEYPALQPYSWHEPVRKSHYNNARNVVSFVDGHVSYVKMYWDTNNTILGRKQAWHYDPPAGYGYKWSGD